MRRLLILLVLAIACRTAAAAEKPPIYVWFEPEWFEGVSGQFGYWQGPAKPMGSWGIAGPGISAEWTQGGESEWNSMGASADETKAECHRDFVVPRAGHYKVWVRYVDHRNKTEPFNVAIDQSGKRALGGELGVKPMVSPGDEYALYWGFSFTWDKVEGDLAAGPARLSLFIDKAGQAFRQVDAVLITDDADYEPNGREKPRFNYETELDAHYNSTSAWRGSAKGLVAGPASPRVAIAGSEFSMWTGIDAMKPDWLKKQDVATLSLYDILFEASPPADVKDEFHKQFAGRKDLPILSWPNLRPGMHLSNSPDLSPDTPLRQWLERTKMPFYIVTNYAHPGYTDKTGPATYQALSGPLANQFMGYIHGEVVGCGIGYPWGAHGNNRREHVDNMGKLMVEQQAQAWSKIYKTPVPETYWAKGIPCLSMQSISLAHLFHEIGSKVIGYELDSTNAHVPMRIAFERGAARQYGGAWINYASGNFGDACDYFTQQPRVPRGARSWYHSKYAVTDGVTVAFYRKLYYLNYLGGASAIHWEQSLENQWMKPGPGEHPIELSPFGRATEDFQGFVSRLPDRGEPVTPVAFLLSYGHGYERVANYSKMLETFVENQPDRELRELFNVAWYPAGVVEGLPAAPDIQSMASGMYGNIFDVLVDRPARAKSLFNYPVVWAAGDVELTGPIQATVEDYVRRGGTLVVNIEAARKLPPTLLGVRPNGKTTQADDWAPEGQEPRAATPFEVAGVELAGASVLAHTSTGLPLVTSFPLGEGKVILTLVPRLMGLDERAHPTLPFVMNGLTSDLLPVEVRLANGSRPHGEVLYQVNKTKDGYLVLLINNRGVDKTQNGVARVDRRQYVDVVLRTRLPVRSAKEYTTPKDLAHTDANGASEVKLRLYPADVQVVGFVTP